MERRTPPDLDMTLEGEFRSPPGPQRPPLMTRIMAWAVVVAILAAALSLAAFALWVALIILPVAIGAAVVAWLAYRFQAWRAGSALGRRQDLWRP